MALYLNSVNINILTLVDIWLVSINLLQISTLNKYRGTCKPHNLEDASRTTTKYFYITNLGQVLM